MDNVVLASSDLPPNIFPWLFLVMMMNRFLRRSPSSRGYLHPQCQDDQVFVMLQRIIYSESHFLDPRFRLLLMSQFGLTIFLMNGLMRPWRLFFYGIDRVKRWFSLTTATNPTRNYYVFQPNLNRIFLPKLYP